MSTTAPTAQPEPEGESTTDEPTPEERLENHQRLQGQHPHAQIM